MCKVSEKWPVILTHLNLLFWNTYMVSQKVYSPIYIICKHRQEMVNFNVLFKKKIAQLGDNFV